MRDTTVLTRAEETPETDAIAKEKPPYTDADYVRLRDHAKEMERQKRRVYHYWGQEKECVMVLRGERDEALAREERK